MRTHPKITLRKETGDYSFACASSASQNLDGEGNHYPFDIELSARGKIECLTKNTPYHSGHKHVGCYCLSTCGRSVLKLSQHVRLFFCACTQFADVPYLYWR